MVSELDMQLKAIMDRLTAPGSPFEAGCAEHEGRRLPAFEHAPPTLPALFAHFCAKHHDREFLIDGELRLSYGEVHALAQRGAASLVAGHGVQRGDRIGIAAGNSANWIIAYMAVLMAGGCATLLNSWWTGEELARGVRIAECKLVLADRERANRLEGHGVDVPILLFSDGEPALGLFPPEASNDNRTSLPELAGEDLATILFTSGSTGFSKAAFSRHRAVVHAAMNIASQAQMLSIHLAETGTPPAEREAALLCVPLFHATGEVAILLKSFFAGRKLVIMPKWSALEAMRLIERERITIFIGVPLMSYEIATHPERGKFDLSSCNYFAAGGAPQPAPHVSQIHESLSPAHALQGYGLTETNGAGCNNLAENYLAKPDSTGPASVPLVELAILGSTGEALPPGMTGEIAIRSICNFSGYWNDPEATRAAIRPDGFFLTGDLGKLDEAGYLFVLDRKKDVIIRGGENIACPEVEQALYSHPGIAEVSVFGLPDAHFGEVPVAVYHAKQGLQLNEEELRLHLQARLAHFKIPVRFWQERQALPRLGTQKFDKVTLKARYSEEWEAATSGR
jgi:acyl-CoA synthetase (AMP-forming)/AMP-acid ligase II